jgi:hypothetical protein
MIADLLQREQVVESPDQVTDDSLECAEYLMGRLIGRAPHQGLKRVPISAQLELFCPPCTPT